MFIVSTTKINFFSLCKELYNLHQTFSKYLIFWSCFPSGHEAILLVNRYHNSMLWCSSSDFLFFFLFFKYRITKGLRMQGVFKSVVIRVVPQKNQSSDLSLQWLWAVAFINSPPEVVWWSLSRVWLNRSHWRKRKGK